MTFGNKIVFRFSVGLGYLFKGFRNFRRQGIPHFLIAEILNDQGFAFRSRSGSAIVLPLIVRIAAAGSENTEIFTFQSGTACDLTHFRNPECCTVFHLEKSGYIAEIAVGKVGVIIFVGLTVGANFHRFASHDVHHTGNRVGGVGKGVAFQTTVNIFLHECSPFPTGFPGGTGKLYFTERT